MDNSKTIQRLTLSYARYNQVIKLLLADVEAKYEALPEQILNEIRAYNDHIARCFIEGTSQTEIDSEIKKADGHLLRTELDCFKLLNVYMKTIFVEKFGKKYKRVNLNNVDAGNFVVKYYNLTKKARNFVKEAKKKESYEKEAALELFQKAYNTYSEIEDLITKNIRSIAYAKSSWYAGKIVSFVIGAFVTYLTASLACAMNNEEIPAALDLIRKIKMIFS